MKKIKYLFPLVLLLLSSCNFIDNLIEVALYPYKKPTSFEYYDKNFQLETDSKIKTENFYFTEGEGASGHYYDYLKFYPDGMVYHHGGTSTPPDQAYEKNYINTSRRKNGIPSHRKASFGYYKLSENGLIFTIIDYTALSENKYKYIGTITNDTLNIEVFEHDYFSKKYKYSHSNKYIYFSE